MYGMKIMLHIRAIPGRSNRAAANSKQVFIKKRLTDNGNAYIVHFVTENLIRLERRQYHD